MVGRMDIFPTHRWSFFQYLSYPLSLQGSSFVRQDIQTVRWLISLIIVHTDVTLERVIINQISPWEKMFFLSFYHPKQRCLMCEITHGAARSPPPKELPARWMVTMFPSRHHMCHFSSSIIVFWKKKTVVLNL